MTDDEAISNNDFADEPDCESSPLTDHLSVSKPFVR